MSRKTINAQRMEDAIGEMSVTEFALVVGKFAFDLERYSDGDAESIISKWWHWTDEIAEALLDEDQKSAVENYNLMPTETCQECYSMTDKFDGEIEHDLDCSMNLTQGSK